MLIFTAVNDFIDFFLLSIFCFCISYLFFFFLLEPCNKKNILITSTKLDLCALIHLALHVLRLFGEQRVHRNPNMKRMTGPIFLALYVEGSVSFSQLFLKQPTVTWCEVNEMRQDILNRLSILYIKIWLTIPTPIHLFEPASTDCNFSI